MGWKESPKNSLKSVMVTKGSECIEKENITSDQRVGKVSVGDMGVNLFMDNLKPLLPAGEITKKPLSVLTFVLSQMCPEQLSS